LVDFEIRQVIGAAVDEVEERLRDADFIAATGALHPLADCRLLEASGGAGRWTLRIHRRFAAKLPAVVAAVVDQRRLTWTEEVDLDTEQHTGVHRIRPDHYGDLLEGGFRTTLRPTDEGSVRIAAGQVRVRVLMGARPVERAIVSGLQEYADAEARLLSTWGSGDR
jgi:hypothetical protein